MVQQIIQIANLTPEQLNDVVRRAVRSELDSIGVAKPNDTPQPDYLTRKETANLLRISLVTLHKLTNEGILQSLNMQGNIRYKRQEVLAAMKEGKNGSTKR